MSENSQTRPKPVIFGCGGVRLTTQERQIFRESNPFGFILFKRNCADPEQLHYLILELKQAVGRDDVVFAIDQEGGRVARLQPPHWAKFPPARTFGEIYERDPSWALEAIKASTRVMAHELTKLGIGINCAPVADLYNPEGTPALGDRAFSTKPEVVTALARAQAETFLANGVLPVIKHMPGHGRLKVDPHHELPRIDAPLNVLEAADYIPFMKLRDLPLAMNSHAIFTAIDNKNPASLSSAVNIDVIRGIFRFDGLLLSDDLTMKALRGTPGDIAKRALAAGNDVILHCSGDTSEMAAINLAIEPMGDQSWARWQHARAMVAPINPAYRPADDAARLDVLLGGLAAFD